MTIRKLLVVWIVLLGAGAAQAVDITIEKANELFAKLPPDDPWGDSKDASTLAWNEAYTIHSLIDLYEASGDTRYLPEVVRRGDRMLSHRDDQRGFKDASGRAYKRWSIAFKYTIGEGEIVDSSGTAVVKLRSTLFAYNHLTKVEAEPAENGRFSIHLTNKYWKRDETFSDLSLDPKDARFVEKIVNDDKPRGRPFCNPGSCSEASQLLRATVCGDGTPKKQSFTLTPLSHAHVGYVGIIYHPLMRFAALVKKSPSLAEYKSAADRFVSAAEESFDELEEEWHYGEKARGLAADEGYYMNCPKGGPEAYDGVGHAFNYLGKLTCSQLLLYELTGKERYRDRATRMCNLFKHRLKLVDGSKYTWLYWYEPVTAGWTKKDGVSINTPHHDPWPEVEDTSHGALDVQMVTAGAAAGVVFDATDVMRTANTFLENVVLPDRSGFYAKVNGTDPNSRYKSTRVGGWLSLSKANPKVLEVAKEVYQKRGNDDLRDLAAILKWEKANTYGDSSSRPGK